MQVEEILRRYKVLLEGHFVLNSGLHSKYYFEKFRILENPEATGKLCSMIGSRYQDKNIEWVIGPTTGGIIIAFETARQLGCKAGFAEERDNKRVVARGFDISGRNVLIVDDVLTTGKSLRETIDAVLEKNGRIIGIVVMIDRSVSKMDFDYEALYKKEVENFKPEECPLCKANIPLTKPGGV
jgi:orotate phosphoribosyltransferase|uniref:Orotate phosphoribosyltransferase n=1 Tax=candidate division WOR-3 bacterium TaxID=2052148 RepID=A0A7V3VUB6_UNCW3